MFPHSFAPFLSSRQKLSYLPSICLSPQSCTLATPRTISLTQLPENGGLPRETSGESFKLAGFCRVCTDYVTFAYLTDVFILDDFQRRGLASWMMRALKELTSGWPNLRGLLLMTDNSATARMYQRELEAMPYDEGPSAGLVMLEMAGNGVKDVPADH